MTETRTSHCGRATVSGGKLKRQDILFISERIFNDES